MGRLMEHIEELTSEKMKGRLAGTDGARAAADYIIKNLSENKIQSYFPETYLQKVNVPASRIYGPATLKIKNWRLRHRIDFGESRLTSVGRFQGPLVILDEDSDAQETLKGKIGFIPERPEDFDLELTLKACVEEGLQGLLFEEGDPRWFHKTTAVYEQIGVPAIRIRKSLVDEIKKLEGALVDIDLPIEIGMKECHNVIAIIKNEKASRTIAMTAHYDHLGDDPAGNRYPGALDNATGVSLLLEIGRLVKENPATLPFNLILGFLTGEESGHWGAKAMIKEFEMKLDAIINLDVLGQNPDTNEIRIGELPEEHWLSKSTQKVLEKEKITGKRIKGRDDATVFQSVGIPTIGLGEYYLNNIGPRIHTPEDRPEAVQMESLYREKNMIVELLREIAAVHTV